MPDAAVVTGGTGFVGSNLVRRLLAEGDDVHLLVRPERRDWRLRDIAGEVVWHEVALEDAEGLGQALRAIRPRRIFHLAAHGAYSSQTDVRRMIATNITGTVNLLEAALATEFEALVNVGSSSEYGFRGDAPDETQPIEPNSHYAVTKAAATMFCRYTAASRSVWVPTLRLYSAYGPWEEPSRLVPALVLAGIEGGLPPLVDPQVARDFVYIDDVIDALVLASTTRATDLGAIYNVGTGTQTTLAALVEIARDHFGIEAAPQWGSFGNRQWDTTVWRADPRKIERELGWRPQHDVADGFRRFAEWLVGNPDVLTTYRDLATRLP